MRHQLLLRPAAFALALAFLGAAPVVRAAGQAPEGAAGSSVRVAVGEAPVFAQADGRSPIVARVRSADILVIIGRENDWYKVRIPHARKLTPAGPDSGYVEVKLVRTVAPVGAGAPVPQRGKPVAASKPQPGAQGWGRLALRPFGEVALQAFAASQSFNAIFGNATGVFYGGGLDMAAGRSLRFGVSFTYLQKSGERAFAYNGESFPLGIAESVSMTPITFNLAYRFAGKKFTPYVGGGAGAVVYRETSEFANSSENVSKTGTAFQVLGGVELPLSGSLSLGIEGQYQGVSGLLGDSGVSQAFGEKDAGGFSVRARLIIGK